MFSKPTVFVVGAGASYELGFPLGDELKDKIAGHLNILVRNGREQTSGDYQIAELLRKYAQRDGARDWNYLLHKAWQIRDALPGSLSIDNVLDAHHADEELVYCGKLAICKSILDAERSSKLYGARRPHDPTIFQKAADTYLIPFFQMLTENVRKENISSAFENVSIVTFNYDRSIERFLPEALATYYGISIAEAQVLSESLEIIHPYGKVGELTPNSANRLDFGDERPDLENSVEGIRTFSEGIADEELQSRIRESYFSAEVLVFLGFAYHPINLQILGGGQNSAARRVVGTAYGLAEPSRDMAQDLIMESLQKTEIGRHLEGQVDEYIERVDLESQTAVGLLRAHFRGLV